MRHRARAGGNGREIVRHVASPDATHRSRTCNAHRFTLPPDVLARRPSAAPPCSDRRPTARRGRQPWTLSASCSAAPANSSVQPRQLVSPPGKLSMLSSHNRLTATKTHISPETICRIHDPGGVGTCRHPCRGLRPACPACPAGRSIRRGVRPPNGFSTRAAGAPRAGPSPGPLPGGIPRGMRGVRMLQVGIARCRARDLAPSSRPSPSASNASGATRRPLPRTTPDGAASAAALM